MKLLFIFIFVACLANAGAVVFTGNPSVDSDGNTVTSNVSSQNDVYASKAFTLVIADYWINSTMQTTGKVGFEQANFTCEAAFSTALTLGRVRQDVWNGTDWETVCDVGGVVGAILPTVDTLFFCDMTTRVNTSGNTYIRCRVTTTAITSGGTIRFDFLSLNLTDTQDPNVTLVAPSNNSVFNISDIDFQFNATDRYNDTMNCSIFINNILMATNASVTNNSLTTLPLTLADGNKTWRVECTDKANNTGISLDRQLTVDTTPPIIMQYSPVNNTFGLASTIPFVINATDVLTPPMNCSIFLDGVLNMTNSTTLNNSLTQWVIQGIILGSHNWSVRCIDLAMNGANSQNWIFSVNTSTNGSSSGGNQSRLAQGAVVSDDGYVLFPAGMIIGGLLIFIVLNNKRQNK